MKHPIPVKIEVTLESRDRKLVITKRIWSDELFERMEQWQELFWVIVRVERKDW
jgi:hypothetical protein